MEKVNNTKTIVFKVLKITLNVFFYLFIAFMLIFSLANIKVKTNLDIPNIFGRGFLSVQSESMNGKEKDSFRKGDLIFVKMLDQDDLKDLEVGDIITYEYYDSNLGRFLNTHRIVEIGDDYSYFVTQGDFIAMTHPYDPDENVPDEERKYEIVNASAVKALHTSTWSGAGKTLDYVQTPSGFAFVIVLPTAILFLLELFFLIRNLMLANREKLIEEHAKEKEATEELLKKQLEAEREALRAQLLEELKKEQQKQDK